MPAIGGGDWSALRPSAPRSTISSATHRITGFATVSGDRHSFWAGLGGQGPAARGRSSRSAWLHHRLDLRARHGRGHRAQHAQGPSAARRSTCATVPERRAGAHVNMLMRHGVRARLEYAAHRRPGQGARALQPGSRAAPQFVDMGGHGYAVVRADARRLRDRVRLHPAPDRAQPDAGRRADRLPRRPPRAAVEGRRAAKLEQRVLEGDPKLSIEAGASSSAG